jgi:hypothetical protein
MGHFFIDAFSPSSATFPTLTLVECVTCLRHGHHVDTTKTVGDGSDCLGIGRAVKLRMLLGLAFC